MSGLRRRTLMILWAAERKRVGEDPNASASIVASQGVKTSEEGGSNGRDNKNAEGRKNPLLVGALGVPLSFSFHTRRRTDRAVAPLIAGPRALVPRLKKIGRICRPSRPRL